MMWTQACLASLIWAVAAGAGVYSQAGGPAARIDPEGQVLYTTHCASCHGTGARGDGPVAESLRVRPADLAQLAARNGGAFPRAKVDRIIDGRDVGAHGSPDMPVWGDAFKRQGLTAQQSKARIEAIVGYLESMQARSAN
jgi:mono/diheme cytochrome c family protein